jgi:retinol-binding protein 3
MVLPLAIVITLSACSPGGEPLDDRPSSSVFEDLADAHLDSALNAGTRDAIIDDVLARLRVAYVFEETAEKMEDALRSRIRRGEYEQIVHPKMLADSLTAHLRAVSHDRHLHVFFSEEAIEFPTLAMRQDRALRMNYGIGKVERLPGNVGYIELTGFYPVTAGVERAVAASMEALASTGALIIDLRSNRGGDPSMGALIASYLLGPERIHLNSIEFRLSDRVREYWTTEELEGQRYGPQRSVYLLTSSHTFSGAEDFTYSLKALGRVTIVGETTGGGAHMTGLHRVTDHIGARIPTGRAINPITGSNWEVTGIVPDLPASGEESLDLAYLTVLQSLLAAVENREERDTLERLIRERGPSN